MKNSPDDPELKRLLQERGKRLAAEAPPFEAMWNRARLGASPHRRTEPGGAALLLRWGLIGAAAMALALMLASQSQNDSRPQASVTQPAVSLDALLASVDAALPKPLPNVEWQGPTDFLLPNEKHETPPYTYSL